MKFYQIFIILFYFQLPAQAANSNIHYMEPGMSVKCCTTHRKSSPEIYCYRGRKKDLLYVWETVQLQFSLPPDKYDMFDGSTPEEVMDLFEKHSFSWSFQFYSTKKENVKLNPFNQTCVGIVTDHDYMIKLNVIRVDYWKIALLIGGLLLFASAPRLSQNSLFYYLTGISVGMCASFLILVYVVGKMMPKKPVMYGFVLGGWTVGLYLIQTLFDNLRLVIVEYKLFVLGYAAVTGLISFVICYRFGPVSDPRSFNLIKWALQACGLILITFSTSFLEAAIAFNVLLLLYYNVPSWVITYPTKTIFRKMFPPKPRLLTEEEYYRQGTEETRKALDGLRGYCSSPECNQWKTMLKLKDPLRCGSIRKVSKRSRNRFAKFVEGSSHLDDSEVLAFETSIKDSPLLTDDESSESD